MDDSILSLDSVRGLERRIEPSAPAVQPLSAEKTRQEIEEGRAILRKCGLLKD